MRRLLLALFLFIINSAAQAAITFGATTKGVLCSNNCSMVINVPAGTVNGDLLLLFETMIQNGCSTPAGWTAITSNNYVTGSSTACAFYRIASSEPASYTLPSQNWPQGFMNDYHGADTINPIRASSNNFTLGHTVTTPTIGGTKLMAEWYVGYGSGDSVTNAMTNTTGDLVHITTANGASFTWDAAVGDKPLINLTDTVPVDLTDISGYGLTDTYREVWTDSGASTGCFGLGVVISPLNIVLRPPLNSTYDGLQGLE